MLPVRIISAHHSKFIEDTNFSIIGSVMYQKRKLKIEREALGKNQFNRFSLDRLSKVFSTTEFHCSYNQICSEDNKQLQF